MNKLACIAALAALSACSMPAPQTDSAVAAAAAASAFEVLRPMPHLLTEDIPPIPMSLVREVEKYTAFRGHGLVDWHPTRREMLVAHRQAGGSTAQLFRLAGPMAQPEQLTDFADPVTSASYEPRQGNYLVFERGSGGDEAEQLYRLDLPGKRVTLLTDPNERHDMQGWLHHGSHLLVSSMPLDKTAEGGSRATVTQTLSLIAPADPQRKRKLIELPGTGWDVAGVSWDDKQVALGRYISANESQVWLLNLATGKAAQVLPAPGSKQRSVYLPAGFKRDNSGIFVLSDRDGEFRELMFYRFATQRLTPITRHVRSDIDGATLSDDGKLLAVRANVDGRAELRLFDARSFKELPLPKLPAGGLGSAQFHRKLPDLAFSLDNTQGPGRIHTIHPASGAVEQWTRPFAPAGLEPSSFSDQQIVRWKSFDGRSISGLLTLPPKRFTGKRPVLVAIHGGPEGQARMGFMGRTNYYLNELGIAVISPNVRGSSGQGKAFLALDNGMKREDAVKDIGALLDWIATQPELDASRVVVAGASYGGYMSLAVSTHYADRIAGAIDVVGISDFVTFLESTESYRRDLRRAEYGDEREPAMRAFLQKISPLANAHKIKKPLFVVQGRNDPRVPYTEAEQIVLKARENQTPVWYLRADNEGHGFARKENSDFQFYATVLFLRATLLK